jgi:hypothetical protein
MAAQIILIVNGEVMRDDGDVIRGMVTEISLFKNHLDRIVTQVASRRDVEDREIAALRQQLDALTMKLEAMLLMRNLTLVDPAAVSALAQDIRENTQRIRDMVPDESS